PRAPIPQASRASLPIQLLSSPRQSPSRAWPTLRVCCARFFSVNVSSADQVSDLKLSGKRARARRLGWRRYRHWWSLSVPQEGSAASVPLMQTARCQGDYRFSTLVSAPTQSSSRPPFPLSWLARNHEPHKVWGGRADKKRKDTTCPAGILES